MKRNGGSSCEGWGSHSFCFPSINVMTSNPLLTIVSEWWSRMHLECGIYKRYFYSRYTCICNVQCTLLQLAVSGGYAQRKRDQNIFLPSIAQQQREMNKFCVVWRKRTTAANSFFVFLLGIARWRFIFSSEQVLRPR